MTATQMLILLAYILFSHDLRPWLRTVLGMGFSLLAVIVEIAERAKL